jgi:hypothetical protein
MFDSHFFSLDILGSACFTYTSVLSDARRPQDHGSPSRPQRSRLHTTLGQPRRASWYRAPAIDNDEIATWRLAA